MLKSYEKTMADSSPEDGFAKYGLDSTNGQDFSGLDSNGEDDADDVANLQAVNLDALGMDENALQILAKNSDALLFPFITPVTAILPLHVTFPLIVP